MINFSLAFGELVRKSGLSPAELSRRTALAGHKVPESSISNAISGKRGLSVDLINAICKTLKTPDSEREKLIMLSYAFREKGESKASVLSMAARLEETAAPYFTSDIVEVPVWDCIKAGTTDLQQHTSEAVGVTEMTLKEKQRGCFCMRVSGKSMEGLRIFDGDIAFFQPLNGECVNERDVYAVEVEGQPCWIVKKITRLPAGKIGLISADGSQPVEINPDSTYISVKGVLIKTVKEWRKAITI